MSRDLTSGLPKQGGVPKRCGIYFSVGELSVFHWDAMNNHGPLAELVSVQRR